MIGTVAALSGRTVRGYLRSPQLVAAAVVFPLLMLFLMLAVTGRLVEAVDQAGYVHRLAPLVVLSTVSFAASLTAVGFHLDTRGPMWDRIRTTPTPPWLVLAGRVVGDLLRVAAVAALVTAVAYLPGFRLRQGIPAALGYFGVVLLVGVLFSVVAALAGCHAATPVGAQAALNAPTIALFFLSTGYLPISAFPGVVQPLVRVNPLSAATDAMVGLSWGGPVLAPLRSVLLWTAGVSVVAMVLIGRRLRAPAAR
jgi:ABC-2 type transport system permease protein